MAEERDPFNEEEYHLAELDDLNQDPLMNASKPDEQVPPQNPTNIRRNALIALGVILLSFLGYQLVNHWMNRKTQPSTVPAMKTVPVTQPQPRSSLPTTPQLAKPVETLPVTSNTREEMLDKNKVLDVLTRMERNQRDLQVATEPLSTQMSSVNQNLKVLGDKLGDLSEALAVLSNKIEAQTDRIETLIAKSKPQIKHQVTYNPPPVFNIQAVIPGRAWLISKNGSTLTVSVGTQIPGYGIVKLIDSRQGKILTSSGRTILFSQQES